MPAMRARAKTSTIVPVPQSRRPGLMDFVVLISFTFFLTRTGLPPNEPPLLPNTGDGRLDGDEPLVFTLSLCPARDVV